MFWCSLEKKSRDKLHCVTLVYTPMLLPACAHSIVALRCCKLVPTPPQVGSCHARQIWKENRELHLNLDPDENTNKEGFVPSYSYSSHYPNTC
jgi:hypothetical protein